MTTPTPPPDEIQRAIEILREDRILAGLQGTNARFDAIENRLSRMPVAEMTETEKAAAYDQMMQQQQGGGGMPPWPPTAPPTAPPGPPTPPPGPTQPPGAPPAPTPKPADPPPADPPSDPPTGKYGSRWLGKYD